MIVHLPMFSDGMPAIANEFFRGLITVVRFAYWNVHENAREYMGYAKGLHGLNENFNAATYNQTSSIINLGYFTPLLLISVALIVIAAILDMVIKRSRTNFGPDEEK